MKRKVLFVILILSLLCISCTKTPRKDSYTIYAMDTVISISFYDVEESKKIAKEIEKIYLAYDAVGSDFTTGGSTVSVYDLNEHRTREVGEELLEMIAYALEMQEETLGYFNPLIGRLSHLWKNALAKNELLEPEIVAMELDKMKHSTIDINDHTVTLQGDANLDLGGIAKGYATQKVKEYLTSISCTSYLLNAGTSNIVLGEKAGESFSVGLYYALQPGYYKTLHTKNMSLGTSSMRSQNSLIDGVYYAHLLNPKTGMPATYYDTLTIFGADSAVLDAYSTACFAMNLDEAKAFLSSKGLEWISCKDNKILYESEGVKDYA